MSGFRDGGGGDANGDGAASDTEGFERAAAHIRSPAVGKILSLNNEEKLMLYAAFKQGSIGDCKDPRPGMLEFTAKAKWDAWVRLKGTPAAEARQEYVELVNNLCPGWDAAAAEPPTQGTAEPESGSESGSESSDDEGGGGGGGGTGFTPAVSTLAANCVEQNDWTADEAIFKAASEGDVHSIARMLEEGISPDTQDAEGRTPLHFACDRGQALAANQLLTHGASVNARDADGQTPLHYAAACDHVHIVELLVAAGADVALQDQLGDSPFATASAALQAKYCPSPT